MSTIDLLRVRDETFLEQVAFHDTLTSTNATALELLGDATLRMPALVITEEQTAGRGRGGNRWWSGPGALTFSVVVDGSEWSPENVCRVSLTSGLAVCQALERFAPQSDLALKWPNDVYLHHKKVCGILIERLAGHPGLVIGIGINVNNTLQAAPDLICQVATSLHDELYEETDRTEVLIEVLRQLERRLHDLTHAPALLWQQWRAYCMLTGREICLSTPDREICGTCHGIREDGALLIRHGDRMVPSLAGVVRASG